MFDYDGLGRRIDSTVVATNTAGSITITLAVTERYAYDIGGTLLYAARTDQRGGHGIGQLRYIYSRQRTQPCWSAATRSSAAPRPEYYALTDWQNNTLSIVSNTGTVLERYTYDYFGSAEARNADWSLRSAAHYIWSHDALYINSSIDWTILYHGQIRDPFSNNYLVPQTLYSVTSGHTWQPHRQSVETDSGIGSLSGWDSFVISSSRYAAAGIGFAVGGVAGAMVGFSMMSSFEGRYMQGESVFSSGLGAVGDATGLGAIYAGVTGEDMGTGEDMHARAPGQHWHPSAWGRCNSGCFLMAAARARLPRRALRKGRRRSSRRRHWHADWRAWPWARPQKTRL